MHLSNLLPDRPRAMRLLLPVLLFASLIASAGTAQAQSLKIVAPKRVASAQKVHFGVIAPPRTTRVAFYVDHRQVWVDRSPRWQLGKDGRLPANHLRPGRNRLGVRVSLRDGRVVVRHRDLYVRPARRHNSHHRHTSREPTVTSSESESTTSAPAQEPPVSEESSPAPEAQETPEVEPETEAETTPEPEPIPDPSGPAAVFASDFQSFSGWYVQALPGRASLVSGSAFSGGSDARFEVRPGDVEPDTGSNRAEVSGPTFNAGEDLYVRDAIRVPAANSFEGSWQIIQQLHESNWSGSPGMALFLGANRSLTLGAGDGSPIFWRGPKLATGRWYDLVYRVKLSSDASVGFVEVWLDGQQQTLVNGQAKVFGQTIQAAQTYLKAGIYRSKTSSGVSVVEHDNIVVGTSLAAVMGA